MTPVHSCSGSLVEIRQPLVIVPLLQTRVCLRQLSHASLDIVEDPILLITLDVDIAPADTSSMFVARTHQYHEMPRRQDDETATRVQHAHEAPLTQELDKLFASSVTFQLHDLCQLVFVIDTWTSIVGQGGEQVFATQQIPHLGNAKVCEADVIVLRCHRQMLRVTHRDRSPGWSNAQHEADLRLAMWHPKGLHGCLVIRRGGIPVIVLAMMQIMIGNAL